ncbi:MAG TPA: hypothetical protein VJM08_14635, partial [Anaerolineales bacterium]|nr:hypothetical protein [Anaerolineales bacterium]
LSSANHLLCSSDVHFIHRTHNHAAVDDHGTDVCGNALGLSSGTSSPTNLGGLTTMYTTASILYVLGSLLFGIAMFRARILPRWTAALFAISGPLSGTMFTLLPYQLVQLTSIPIGTALVWLGYALFSERGQRAAETVRSGFATAEAAK